MNDHDAMLAEIQVISKRMAYDKMRQDTLHRNFIAAANERDGAKMDELRAQLHELTDQTLDAVARLGDLTMLIVEQGPPEA